jgi:hypothetical protein
LHAQSFEKVGGGIEISYIRPNPQKEFGFVLNPAPGIALTARSSNELHFRWGTAFGYVPFKTTMDVFPVWGYESGDNNKKVYQGEQTFKNNRYHYFYGAGIGEFKVLKTPLSPIVGLDFRINWSSYTINTFYPENPYANNGEEHFNNISMSFVPKAGVVYDLEDFSFLLTAGYNWDLTPRNVFPYMTVSLCVIYYFE